MGSSGGFCKLCVNLCCLTACSRVLPMQLIVLAGSQEIPCVLWNAKVHCSVHKSQPLIVSWARLIQSTPSHPISLSAIFVLLSHLFLGLLNCVRQVSPPKLCMHILSPTRMTCSTHPPWFYHPQQCMPSHCDAVVSGSVSYDFRSSVLSMLHCTCSALSLPFGPTREPHCKHEYDNNMQTVFKRQDFVMK